MRPFVFIHIIGSSFIFNIFFYAPPRATFPVPLDARVVVISSETDSDSTGHHRLC